ncbi:unnamed protein product [Prorocentrum cordatum]|uniref:Uncharacterized protein n=1 Tax=Prorocentrum cordatum TaxID=2364126 RepID=A0ABN9YBY6_9DINO|nr:unnamed protein product [Polarella glacialis]
MPLCLSPPSAPSARRPRGEILRLDRHDHVPGAGRLHGRGARHVHRVLLLLLDSPGEQQAEPPQRRHPDRADGLLRLLEFRLRRGRVRDQRRAVHRGLLARARAPHVAPRGVAGLDAPRVAHDRVRGQRGGLLPRRGAHRQRDGQGSDPCHGLPAPRGDLPRPPAHPRCAHLRVQAAAVAPERREAEPASVAGRGGGDDVGRPAGGGGHGAGDARLPGTRRGDGRARRASAPPCRRTASASCFS